MKSIMIQFHATTEELIDFVSSVNASYKFDIVVMAIKPFRLVHFNHGSLNDIVLPLMDDSDVRIILNLNPLNLHATSPNIFFDINPNCIVVDIGRYTGSELNESGLSFISDNSNAVNVANKVASKLKKITKAGVVAVNPETGAEARIRSHRYTDGAKNMFDAGVSIVPVAGKSILKFSS